MRTWIKISIDKPTVPVLCLLNNGYQAVLAFDEENGEWAFYDENKLEDAYVVAWSELDSNEEVLKQLK